MSSSQRFALAVAVSLAAFAATPPAARAAAPGPRFYAPDTVRASAQFTWTVPLGLSNPAAVGLYVDSLTLRTEDLGAGETRAARVIESPLPVLVKLLPTIAAHDSSTLQFVGPATRERARLTFTFLVHQAEGKPFTLERTVEAVPGPTSSQYPSHLIMVNGRKVETVLVPSLEDGPAPGLLLIHGHASNARLMLPLALQVAKRGYTVMLVSMPGYGLSQGPADFMGPATLAAAEAALDSLEAVPSVRGQKVGAWGVSRGATVALELAQARKELACAIGQSGIYDLWAVYRDSQVPGIRDVIVNEAGRDSAAWTARSPAVHPAWVNASVLLLHGDHDPNAPVAQAKWFYDRLLARGKSAQAEFLPNAGHQLPQFTVNRTVFNYLETHLHQ